MEEIFASIMTSEMNYFLQVMKVFLGFLAIIYFVYFYFSWNRVKYKVSIMTFYAFTKIIRKGSWMVFGIFLLFLSFICEIAVLLGFLQDTIYVIINIFQVVSLIFIGFSFYALMRVDMPMPMEQRTGSPIPTASLPLKDIENINRQIIPKTKRVKKKRAVKRKKKTVKKKTKRKTKKKTVKKRAVKRKGKTATKKNAVKKKKRR